MRLIDADALVADIIEDRQHQSFATYAGRDRYMAMSEYAHDWVADAPTIDAEPVRHGRWKEVSGGRIICNNCGHYPLYDYFGRQRLSFYCWHCGAKMDLEG